MKANPLLIAVVVLAALGGLAYYTSENPPEPESDTVSMIDVEEADIRQVAVVKPGGETITVERGDDDAWKFGGGLNVPADDSAIGLMVGNLASMNADRVVQEETANWAPYGLEGDGALRVTMTPKEGDPKTVVFGSETPTGAGMFARIDGDPRLFTVFNYVKSSFDKTVFDWRDKKLLRVDPDKIARVTVDVGQKSFEFGKAGEQDWQILKPKPLRADNFSVGDLVRSIQNAEMVEVLAEGEEAAAFVLGSAFATAKIVDDAGEHTLTIAKAGDAYRARSSDLDGVYEVSSTVAQGLDKSLDEFRNKKLFDFGFTELKRIEVRAGDDNVAVEKRDDGWVLTSDSDREVESSKAQTLIDALRNLTAVSFPSDDAAAQARYGLTAPQIEAAVTPAADGGKGETVVISNLSASRIYAARQGESTTYEVEAAPAAEIRRAVTELLAQEEETAAEEGEATP